MVYEIETATICENFSENKEGFDFNNYSKYYDDSNAIVVGKMKDEMGGVATDEFVRRKLKLYLILRSDSSESKKRNVENKIVVFKIAQNKNVLLNKKCLRHSMNWIQSKSHRIGTYKIHKIHLSCFDVKIYILGNETDVLALGA